MKKIFGRFLKIEAALLVAVVIACTCSVAGFAYKCSGVRENVLRMHVIANSDSDEDQALKLKVRDAVLKRGSELFDGTLTADEARAKLEPEKDELIKAASEVITAEGFDYPVSVEVVDEYFATRCYGELTMPAGNYTAIKVVIGEGEGKNWWCVMFPPLCLPAAQGEERTDIDAFLDDGEIKVVKSSEKYEPRFKIVEIIEKIRDRIESKT